MARLVVLQIATRTAAEIAGARLAHSVLAQQLVRSSSSVALNLAEGAGRFGRDRRNRKAIPLSNRSTGCRLYHFRIAYGSCQEAKTTVEILVLSGHLDRETGRRWWSSLHRIGGLIWGLMKLLH